jgi:putative transposase
MLKQVDAAFGRFFRGLGKYPKTKQQGKFRSFTYARLEMPLAFTRE